MEQRAFTSPNAKRWGLIILNIVFFFGVFQPLFEVTNEVSAWNLRRYLANGISRMDQAEAALISILITLFLLVLIADPIVHLLKLLGVFGEAKRNSRSLGMMLSLLELIALIVVPSTVVLAYFQAGSSIKGKYLSLERQCFRAAGKALSL